MAVKRRRKKFPTEKSDLQKRLEAAGAKPPKPKKSIGEKIVSGLEKVSERFPTEKSAFAQPLPGGPIDPRTGKQVTTGTVAGAGAIASPAAFGSLPGILPETPEIVKSLELAKLETEAGMVPGEAIKVAGAGVKGQQYAQASAEIYGSQISASMYKTGITAPGVPSASVKAVTQVGEMGLMSSTKLGAKYGMLGAAGILSVGALIVGYFYMMGHGFWAKKEATDSPAYTTNLLAKDAMYSGKEEDWEFFLSYIDDVEVIQKQHESGYYDDVPFLKDLQRGITGSKEGTAQAKLSIGILKEYGENKLEAIQSGKTLEEVEMGKIGLQRIETEKEIIRLRDLATQETIQLWEMHDASKLANEKKALKETIDLWAEHQKNMIRLEEEKRNRDAQFWLEYTRQKLAMEEAAFKGRIGQSSIPGILWYIKL